MSAETTMTPPVDWQPGDELKAGRRMAGGMLEKAKTALSTFAELVKWAAYDDAEPNEPDQPDDETTKAIDVVTIGPAVKALGDGRIGGYLVMFGDPANTDLTGDYFTPDTDFDLEDGLGKSTVLYHHGQDATLKRRKLGRAALRTDEVGVWIEAQLQQRDDYERAIYDMAEAGKMGWSSGTAPHLVERERQANGASKITRWPLGLDASVTPIPAEPRIRTMPLKAYTDMAEPYVKALLPQADAQQAPAVDATKGTPSPQAEATTEPDNTGVYDMTPEEIKALMEDTINAYEAKLAAAPAINPAGVLTQPAEVKSKPEGFKTIGEQLIAVRNAATGYSYDRRLDATKAILGGNESIPSEGGFLVSTAQASGLDKKVWDQGVFSSRADPSMIPAGANSMDYFGLSENSRADGSRYGGITGYRMAEGATKTASGPQNFYKYTLKPKKYAIVAYLTDEVLNDARMIEQELQAGVVGELDFMVNDDMFRGLGVAGAYGVINHPALITVDKEVGQAADTVIWKNITKMWGRRYARGNYTWYINQEVEEQLDELYQAIGTSGVKPNYVTYSADGVMRIKGAPVVVNEFSSAIGDLGDIVLADWSQYKLAAIGGVESASSMHVAFLTDQMCYRFVRRVDGLPTWQSDLTPYKGTKTQSPFITLEAR